MIDLVERANDLRLRIALTRVIEDVTQVVTELERKFLPILGLFDREILVHGISGEMIDTVERLIALDNPADWKIVTKLDGRFMVAHKELLL
jgi:hypothetical protein